MRLARLYTAALLASVAFAAPASAVTTYDDALALAFQQAETTVIMEDNDRFTLTDVDDSGGPSLGDIITGMLHIQAVDRDGLVPPNTIRTTTQAPQNGSGRTILGDGSGSVSSYTGIFSAQLVGTDLQGTTFLAPLAGSAPGLVWTFTDGSTYVQVGPEGSIIELYEDNGGLTGTAYDDSTPALAVATGLDGALHTVYGFTAAPGDPANVAGGVGAVGMNAAGEVFQNFDFNNDGFADLFEVDLNVLFSTSSWITGSLPNDIMGPDSTPGYPYGTNFSYGTGTQIHGAGTFSPPPIGNPWDSFSDGNFGLLTIPTPSAALVGLVAFGSLGFRRRTRGGLLSVEA